jgi:uncharacterized damage-inducible protein DinB
MELPEPWLRGPIPDVHPLIAPILYAFEQAREDLARYTEGLDAHQIWATPHGLGSLGFHIRHIAGSTSRLMTYLEGKQLSESQMAALREETSAGYTREQQAAGYTREQQAAGATRRELLADLDAAFREAERVVRSFDPARLAEPREVGRKRLPTTVIGLLAHIAEHTQRHVGQAISAAKLARATV